MTTSTISDLELDYAAFLEASPIYATTTALDAAQSNFSGVQHPLEWIATAQARGWDVLLDAAAFVPTNRLNLSHVRPDYVALSFYKMFGHPTGGLRPMPRRGQEPRRRASITRARLDLRRCARLHPIRRRFPPVAPSHP